MSFLNPTQFGAGCIFVVLALLAGHWFPWSSFLNGHLPRIPAYAYGVTTIWLAAAIWLYPQWELVGGLLAICVTAGVVVTIAHVIDDYAMVRRKARIGDREFGDDE